MSIEQDSKIYQAERVAARIIDGKAVVIVIDDRKLHTLNPTGTRIWELADGRTYRQLVDTVVQEFSAQLDANQDQVRDDTDRFVHELSEIGALRITS